MFSTKSGVESEINLPKENQNRREFKAIYGVESLRQYMKKWVWLQPGPANQ